MAQRPTYVKIDLSTSKSSEDKACVDIKLLESFFKHYEVVNLNDLKLKLKNLIDDSCSVEEINEKVVDHLYITGVATAFHVEMGKMPKITEVGSAIYP